ncbi:MAG TPA: hypothetical protein VNI20_06360, partial [Fimbriimonadaceae bacterium]|nr:hypothetical protein [Fimbriimonadaceae bacterium]
KYGEAMSLFQEVISSVTESIGTSIVVKEMDEYSYVIECGSLQLALVFDPRDRLIIPYLLDLPSVKRILFPHEIIEPVVNRFGWGEQYLRSDDEIQQATDFVLALISETLSSDFQKDPEALLRRQKIESARRRAEFWAKRST